MLLLLPTQWTETGSHKYQDGYSLPFWDYTRKTNTRIIHEQLETLWRLELTEKLLNCPSTSFLLPPFFCI